MILLKNINKYFLDENKQVLHNIDLTISEGEIITIMGPSGAGKSTLLNIIGLIDQDYSGTYLLNQESMKNKNEIELSQIRNEKIGFIFQHFNLIELDTVFENIELPLLYSKKKVENITERIMKAIQIVGMAEYINTKPKYLSGGQKQRVAIARALVNKPKLVIADEPTGSLDSESTKEIMELLVELNSTYKITILIVTHDPKIVEYCNRLIMIHDGKIITNEGI